MSKADGGSDLNDGAWDSDGDGLSDYYEQAQGLDPQAADGDGDGLTDQEELYLGTNPLRADSDGDQLNDALELEGWIVSYGKDGSGNLLTTRVWSNPNVADADGDTLNDFIEYLFGFHPAVATDPSLVTNAISFDDVTVDEDEAPVLLLDFEETNGARAFADRSGKGHNASCESGTTCPTAGQDGAYGNALQFDGTDDLLGVASTEDINWGIHPQATLSAWFWVDDKDISSRKQVIYEQGGTTRGLNLYVYDGHLYGGGWNDDVSQSDWSGSYISTTIQSNTWHHAALVLDGGETVAAEANGTLPSEALKLYLDGTLVGSAEGSQLWEHSGDNGIGAVNDDTKFHDGDTGVALSDYFAGKIDEVTHFDHALSLEEANDALPSEARLLTAGQYNPNDLLVAQGDTLTFESDVTNNLDLRNGTGIVVGDMSYAEPDNISDASVVLHFEEDEKITTLINAMGESSTATCLTDTTCPDFRAAGGVDYAAQFNGTDDVISLPAFPKVYEDYSEDFTIAFWLNVSALPAEGEVASILEAESREDGNLDIYLRPDGKVALEVLGDGVVYLSDYSFSGNLDSWQHFAFTFESSNYGSNQETFLYVNADGDNGGEVDSHTLDPILGPWIMGNSVTGKQAFSGLIDEFVLFIDYSICTCGGNNEVNRVKNGNYTQDLYGQDEDYFEANFVLAFEDDPTYDGTIFYEPELTCSTAATCPTLTDGYSNEAAIFDGVDDYLEASNSATRTTGTGSIVSMVKLSALPTGSDVAYLFSSENSGTSDHMELYINANGQIVFEGLDDTHTSSFAFDNSTLNQWVHIKAGVRNPNVIQRTITSYIDVDGSQDSSISQINYTQTVWGPGRIGSAVDGSGLLNGVLDEYSAPIVNNLTFDAPPFDASFVNAVNDAKAFDCVYSLACPKTDGDGVLGSALAFDGTNDYISKDSLDFARGDYTIATWFKTDASGTFFAATDQASDQRGILLHVQDDGTLRYLDRFPTAVSGGTAIVSSSTYNDTTWHHLAAVKENNTMTLYVDGESVGTATTSSGADAPLSITMGKDSPSGSTALYDGLLDEMVVIPSAISAEGVQLLMEGAYPAASVTPASTSFSVPAETTSTVSGTISIEADAPSSVQTFEHVAEATVILPEEDILIPIIDQNESDLAIFMPFEDVPLATTFEDLVDTNEGSCSGDTCPTSALRGLIDRAAYFDGYDDYITHDRPGFLRGSISVAAWVKADRGTIIDTRRVYSGEVAEYGLQLDVNQFNVRIPEETFIDDLLYDEVLTFEIPENEWTHVVGVYDVDSDMAYVYLNGSLVNSAATYDSADDDDDLSHGFTYYIGRNALGGDPLHGELSDLRVYETALSASDVQALYNNAAPLMRFEFDEESDATAFVDTTPNEYSGLPITTECAAVNLDTLTVTSLTTDPSDVYINLADEQLAYVNDVSSGSSTELTGASILCESAALEVGIISTSSTTTGTQTIDPTVTGSGSYTFISGSDSLTVTWEIPDEPAYKVSPQPGTDGQIGNVALFDGEGVIEVPDASSELELISDFTIMTWINTTETGVGILAKNDDDTTWEVGEKVFYLDDSGYPTFVGHSNQYIRSATVANQGVWTHVAASWDASAGTGKIYINGVDATSSSTYAANNADNSGDTIKIGASNHNINEAGNNFTGQMDELAVYQRTLSDEEIDTIYLLEVRWYRERAEFAITIDAEAPEISLLSDYAYRANQYTTLAVGTSDDTSYVQLVDVGIQAPSAANYSWQDAPVCLDSENGSAWCPTFDPTSLGGEGAYVLIIRAVDAVGHETTSEVTTIYVDDSAPQASSTYSGELASGYPSPLILIPSTGPSP